MVEGSLEWLGVGDVHRSRGCAWLGAMSLREAFARRIWEVMPLFRRLLMTAWFGVVGFGEGGKEQYLMYEGQL